MTTAPPPPPPRLPVGYVRFHRSRFLTYQLNRLYSSGYMRRGDLEAVAARVRTFADWAREFARLAQDAETDGRLANAAFAHRAAELLAPPGSAVKSESYNRFVDLFDVAFAAHGLQRRLVPYRTGALPVLQVPPRGDRSRGVVLAHGGFDSLIEEFIAVYEHLAAAGYEVLAFEGPGQGAALRRHGLTFDHDWERPVAAVLDDVGREDVTILGISMGGYWCLRAAAFEPRISRVIVMGSVLDWLEQLPRWARWPVRAMARRRRFMNTTIRWRMRLVPVLDHAIHQCLMQIDGDQPVDAVDWLLQMNAGHQHPERVTQDVLLLHGEQDRFQPLALHRAQRRALISARSVSERVFTEQEHAAAHCQMGNLGLAIDEMVRWLDATSTAPAVDR